MPNNISGTPIIKPLSLAVASFIFTVLLALMACSPSNSHELKPVKHAFVCMGTDQVPGKAMIPIKVDGKTYYGCCPKCNERLRSDKRARMTTDPVTAEVIDKADAFIVEGPGGIALYFKSEDTAKKYFKNIGS